MTGPLRLWLPIVREGGTKRAHICTERGSTAAEIISYPRKLDCAGVCGAQGDTNAEFNNKITAWNAAWNTFNTNAGRFSTGRTECVGITIDQFHQSQPGGARLRLSADHDEDFVRTPGPS